MAMRPYTYIDFASEPIPLQLAADGTVAAAGDNENTVHHFIGGTLESNVTGALTTDLPVFAKEATNGPGMNTPLLSADAVAMEFGQGVLTSAHMEFTIGTSPAFFVRLKADIPDVSDYDVVAVGFRKQGAYQNITTPATHALGYDDLCTIGIHDGAGAINTVSELNNSGSATVTDTTDAWTDGLQVDMKVLVSATGVVTFQHDVASAGTLAAPTAVGTFTFDTGDVVIPYFVIVPTLDIGASGDAISLISYECGYQ